MTSAPTSLALEAQGLGKHFDVKGQPRVQALQDVSLQVPSGGLAALVGPDGAGKTTLLRLAAGLLRADAGKLHVLGIDVARDPQAVQNRISYMPQRFGLYEDLSVQENLDLYADLHAVPRQQRATRFARLMEMTDLGRFTARPAGKLSGGMKQKLGLACTLVRSPNLLLLDEPTVGVDPLSRRELWEIVQQLVDDEKLSVIVSTSYLDEAERCSQVFVMHESQILARGTPGELRGKAEGLTFVAGVPQGMPARVFQARLLDASSSIVDAVPQAGDVHFIVRPQADQDAIRNLLQNAKAEAVPARLEDGFMLLLREHRSKAAAGALPPAGATPSDGPKDRQAPGAALRVQEQDRSATGTGAGDVVIEVKDLVRKFGDFTAVASTSFQVHRGEIFGLLGPNGAGKTTTFRMLCGLLPASSGFLQVAGVNLRHARAQARARIGYVSQKFALYGNLSVLENLDFFGGAYGLRGNRLRTRVNAVLDEFDLRSQEDSPSGQLPGGYKQRLAMAAGLLHEPEILFLDEPTSGADALARREFWRRITSLSASGVTVIITTHFMEEAEYCDRIVIQDAGQLLAIGTPHEVRRSARVPAGERASMEDAFIGIVTEARQARNQPQATAREAHA